ncbi:TylF/MycF/NovP-related O-methyltransferase, partial [Aerococcus mictus]|uniref:TylF/MycF/NovP-related O-methyltransferase n=1 Tax=Aerococcus mictus TaxID=2976810 RepID=UPI000DCC9CE2|nr:macrocin O-methyltransferase [Aerococcus mictus]
MPLAVDYRFVLLAKIGAILYPHYRFKWPQMDWIHDEDFNAYLSRFDELNSWNSERRWLVWQLIRLTKDVEGDTAECGAFEGADSYLICKANDGKRQHHIFDSFEGLSRPDKSDGTYWQEGGLARSEEIVARNLAEFSAYTLYRGWIPSRFGEVANHRFSFVHIDVDLHRPTLDSLAFFYPRMNDGGIIICDDYGSSVCPGATSAVNEFLADKPEKMIPMPCAGGFLIKGISTTPRVYSRTLSAHGLDESQLPSWGKICVQMMALPFRIAFSAAKIILRKIVR